MDDYQLDRLAEEIYTTNGTSGGLTQKLVGLFNPLKFQKDTPGLRHVRTDNPPVCYINGGFVLLFQGKYEEGQTYLDFATIQEVGDYYRSLLNSVLNQWGVTTDAIRSAKGEFNRRRAKQRLPLFDEFKVDVL